LRAIEFIKISILQYNFGELSKIKNSKNLHDSPFHAEFSLSKIEEIKE